MKTLFVFMLLACLGGTIFISCKGKCNDKTYPSISSTEYAMIPYKNNDVLHFIHNQQDNIDFRCQGVVDSSHTTHDVSYCNPIVQQYHSCTFISSDNQYKLSLTMEKVLNNTTIYYTFSDSPYVAYPNQFGGFIKYADSVSIQHKQYNDVKKVTYPGYNDKMARYMLYNFQSGVLRIQNGNSDLWELAN